METNWLKWVAMQVDMVDETEDCKGREVQKNDHVVPGTPSARLKRLYTLKKNARLEQQKLIAELQLKQVSGEIDVDNEELVAALQKQVSVLQCKADALDEIFWIGVKEEYDLWDKESVGIRKGWTIVWTDEDNSPKDFFKKFRQQFEGM